MKIFIDGANVEDVRYYQKLGFVDGVTTNPSIIAKTGQPIEAVIAALCGVTDGPVSAEVISTEAKGMIAEGQKLARLASNVVIKVPLTAEGLQACYALRQDNIDVNVTLCFSAAQALLAAKAGATFVSPFVGRLDDISQDGLALISEICLIFEQYPALNTEVLVASIRSPQQVVAAAKMGAHIATLPAKVLAQMLQHPLTEKGIEQFLSDWKNVSSDL